MRVLLITPPMVQFNAPYPAVPALAAHVRRCGYEVAQEDLSLALALRIFSRDGLRRIVRAIRRRASAGTVRRTPAVRHLLAHAAAFQRRVGPVLRFLQDLEPSLAASMVAPGWLPEGPRLRRRDPPDPEAGLHEVARHWASLFLDDLADAMREGLDAEFALSRYAERLAADRVSFDALDAALARRPGLLERMLDDLADDAVRRHRPDVVGITVPFPGAAYGAFRVARRVRRVRPDAVTVLGGGYVNTELRELSDTRVFAFFDYVTLDDGEVPLERLLDFLAGKRGLEGLVRTFHREAGRVVLRDEPRAPALRHRDRPVPDAPTGASYIAMAESDNPMHRLWSSRRWNKLVLAHGCYWRRCAFCDTSLDYIRRFDPADAETAHRWIESMVRDTGETGFHFADEAAPPALLCGLAEHLIARGPAIEWWANIRLEKSFTPELVRRLADSGCVAMTGGLETACDRTLRRMKKGVSVREAVRALRACSEAGVMTHAYLMYGFPTQTVQETIDALELVRQLMIEGWLRSAFWHRFALTVHSAMFRDPERFGIRLTHSVASSFARNEAPFVEPGGADHDRLGEGLQRATRNYLRGAGLEIDIRRWFEIRVPKPGWGGGRARRLGGLR